MPALTRRRYPRTPGLLARLGDVPVGTIARRVGQSHDQDARQRLSGFYTGSDPGEQSGGTAPTFEQARADFGVAWREFSAQRTEAGYQAWRDQRDWTERKYAMWECGERFPSQRSAS
jgi:hypothetical protein